MIYRFTATAAVSDDTLDIRVGNETFVVRGDDAPDLRKAILEVGAAVSKRRPRRGGVHKDVHKETRNGTR